jgi:hypothetical protein
MKLPIYQVDAFADELFSGNPAAVVIHEIELKLGVRQLLIWKEKFYLIDVRYQAFAINHT